jgi:hypothetical protein
MTFLLIYGAEKAACFVFRVEEMGIAVGGIHSLLGQLQLDQGIRFLRPIGQIRAL